MTKAIALLSGGLDSQLAAKIMLDQGIEVIGVNFKSAFFGASPAVTKAGENLNIPIEILDFSQEQLNIVKAPKFGYGKNMNPCIDCHALMFKIAGDYMKKIGADFLITGEVLGQRPKSQMITGLNTVENASGYKGYILRPLSAKLLPLTFPEHKGLVNRELLLDISGRSRIRQMALAEEFDLHDYPSPAGGCKLTEPAYGIRLRKFFQFDENASCEDMAYLKIARHFLIDDNAWLVIGRNKEDNEMLRTLRVEHDYLIASNSHFGPDAILRIKNNAVINALLQKAAAITASYGKGKGEENIIFTITPPHAEKYELKVNSNNFGLTPIQ